MTDAGTCRPYRPSNGTEGDIFMAQWCERCALADYDGEHKACEDEQRQRRKDGGWLKCAPLHETTFL